MKMITLEGTRDALRDLRPEITLPEDVLVRAERALTAMLELGG
jgi:quinolinate synthase